MIKSCLGCDAAIYDIFASCPECGLSPTDPSLRKGAGKEQYDREQGRDRYALSIRQRGNSAGGLEHDLLTEVPLLYGNPTFSPRIKDPGIELARIHREGLIKKHSGGILPGAEKMRGNALPGSGLLFLISVLIAAGFLFEVFF